MAGLTSHFLVRSLSTSSSRQQLVKAPLQLFTLEGRYATALYSAATKQKALPAVEKDLKDFAGLLKTDAPLRELLLNPLLNKELKKDAVDFVLKKKQANELTVNLFGALAENRRLTLVQSVVNAFSSIMAAHRGEVVCEVVTAKELDAATNSELQTALKSFLKQGESLNLSLKVDPSIIGGMIVSIGDKYVDMSISSKINKYTSLIEAAV